MGWWKESIIVKEMTSGTNVVEVLLTYQALKLWRPTASRIFCGGTALSCWRACTVVLACLDQIEIHPVLRLSQGVFIDHGSGLVIGETALWRRG